MFGRGDKPVEHTITKGWRSGQETHDYVQKVWSAACTCGWRTAEGSFMHVSIQESAHENDVALAEAV